MKTEHYTYEDFLVFSLGYLGLSSYVVNKIALKSHPQKKEDHLKILAMCDELDGNDRAKHFRFLYRRFLRQENKNRDQLLNDMLEFCA
ncbi:MAG: hypothetical protein JNJ58_05250 [Chitinophagaceae bacterium]|nr:hypothetical protein [Chitinophagaceae bacterium]